MTTQVNKKERGFTIIEVMIVLGIAAAIMVIVFLAVPGVQRNSRNTQRRADANLLVGAVAEHMGNNNGALPATAQFSTAFTNTNPTLGYYTSAGNVQWNYSASARASVPGAPAGTDAITVFNFLKCNSTGTLGDLSGATLRSIVALFNVETAAGSTPQCVGG